MDHSQGKKIAEALAEFVVHQKFEDLPKQAVEKAKVFSLDLVGCMIGASREQQAQILVEVVKAEGGNPQSSVVAQGFKTSSMNAALKGSCIHPLPFSPLFLQLGRD